MTQTSYNQKFSSFCLQILGQIDRVDENGLIHGWAFDPASPDRVLDIEVRADNQPVGEGRTGIYQDRFAAAGMSPGTCGFALPVCIHNHSGRFVYLTLHELHTGKAIAAYPFRIDCLNPVAVISRDLGDSHLIARALPQAPRNFRRIRAWVTRIIRPLSRVLAESHTDSGCTIPGVPAKLQVIRSILIESSPQASWLPELTLPECTNPTVSVIIPVHNKIMLTYQCLVSLILSEPKVTYEVLLVDDQSSDATIAIELRVRNLRVIRNTHNLGFLRSCNRAATEARGSYLVFLNNDTEVLRGWLDNLLSTFQRFDKVGAAGSKLIYPDGRLQDAGGIVWSTGKPWNVGHGADPCDPQFNYVRDVDYLSGAALMVSKEAWECVGGFSDVYTPAYYEDTDLAFKLRESGYRTLYSPQSTVVHYEGVSNGRSVETGVKRHQLINANTFVQRWRHRFDTLGIEGENLILEKDRNRLFRVLMVDNAFPKLGNDAGSYAAIQEIRLMQALGAKITFVPVNLQHLGKHVDALQRIGVECVHQPACRSLRKFLRHRGKEFDVIYITRYTVAEKILPLLRQFSGASVVLNIADLHFLRELRGCFSKGWSDVSGPTRTRQRELAVMAEVDAIVSYSDMEHQIIASHLLRIDHIFKCPWVLQNRSGSPALESRRDIAFLGGFAHPPNREAMDWFIANVMPALHREKPGLNLNIWGSHLPKNTQWQYTEGVILRGYAESLDEIFDACRVFIAPLQSGAGVKGKVLDSVSYGVPAVLSPVAVESTGLVHGSSTHVARSVEEWTRYILELLENDVLWYQRARSLSRLVREEYAFESGVERMRCVFDYLGIATAREGSHHSTVDHDGALRTVGLPQARISQTLDGS